MEKLLEVLELIHADADAWQALILALGPELDDMPEDPTPEDFVEAIEAAASDGEAQITVQTGVAASLNGDSVKLFALPSYGWDGGSSISSSFFNLVTLGEASIGGGPCAAIGVVGPFKGLPGISIHNAMNEGLFEVHVHG